MTELIIACISVLSSIVLCKAVLVFFPRWGLMDRPDAYGLKRKPIPYSAGIIIPMAFFFLIPFFVPLTKEFLGFFLGGLLITIVSFVDDRIRLSTKFRAIVHLLVGVIVVLSGIGIDQISHPLGGADISLTVWQIPITIGGMTYHLTPLADLFTILWVFFVMNAVNLLDGIPGLVSGIGTIASFTLWILCILLVTSPLTTFIEKIDATHVGYMALCLGCVLAVFNRFDFFPPKFIIGDTGAMFIGFALAILSIFAGGKVATMLIVLGLPLVDMLWVAIRRISKGLSPTTADHNHYHHKLLRLGLSERAALYTFYAISIVLGITSLYLMLTFRSFGKFIVLLCITLLIVITSILLINKEEKNTRGF